MTNEFIREVDEEYRRDRVMQIWSRFSGVIIAVAILIVAAVGGWRYWQHVERSRAEAAALRYSEALNLDREGKASDAEKVLEDLARQDSGGYRALAKLRLASLLAQRDPAEGEKAFTALASDGELKPVLQDYARLRGAMITLDRDPAAAQAPLERLASETNPWRHSARELLGLAALKRGDFDAASKWFDAIAADRETPSGLRGRLEIYTALAAGGPVQVTQ